MKGYDSLLASVSRSFYLSMHFLPKCMHAGISIAYLLARATDSVADTSSATIEKRKLVLIEMGRAIESLKAEEKVGDVEFLPEDVVHAQQNEGERVLLSRFGECLTLARSLPEEELLLVKRVLKIIVEGQLWDLTYFELNLGVSSAEETDRYAYQVAGCVGEFWTDMASLCLGDSFAVRRGEEMRGLGVRFGKGLQLVNILRDREEDREKGRAYLPEGEDVRLWIDMCRSYLEDGVRYARALKSRRLRFASVLPAWLGMETLDLIEEDLAQKGKKKVARSVVRRLMVKAFVFSWKRPRLH